MHINSVLNSFSIMKVFLGRERSLTLKAISLAARMPPSKAHRYLQSLIACGMVAQDIDTGRYGLGPMAIEYGLAGLAKIDPVRNACKLAAALSDELDLAAAVSVPAVGGPVYIAVDEPASGAIAGLRAGAAVPLHKSAAGRVFLAHLPRAEAIALIQALRPLAPPPSSAAAGPRPDAFDFDRIVQAVRQAGHTVETAGAGEDVHGVAVPVFGAGGRIVAAISIFGRRPEVLDPRGPVIRRLCAEAQAISVAGGEWLRSA